MAIIGSVGVRCLRASLRVSGFKIGLNAIVANRVNGPYAPHMESGFIWLPSEIWCLPAVVLVRAGSSPLAYKVDVYEQARIVAYEVLRSDDANDSHKKNQSRSRGRPGAKKVNRNG